MQLVRAAAVQQGTVCLTSSIAAFRHFVRISEQTAVFPLYNVNW